MEKLHNFIFYNNTIPIALGILFLGAGATFAASPEAMQVVVASEQKIASIDNSYLLETDITEDTVQITIASVTEDEDMYFIEYRMTTIEIVDGAWQPITKTRTFEVMKDSVVSRDLGLYVAEELEEVYNLEIRQLKEFQENAQLDGLTPKAVATEYTGLVGQFFDAELEVFPSYDPLIDPNIGVPLTREQRAEHDQIKRLAEEVKEKESEKTINDSLLEIEDGTSEQNSTEQSEEEQIAEEETPSAELIIEDVQSPVTEEVQDESDLEPEFAPEPEPIPESEPVTP